MKIPLSAKAIPVGGKQKIRICHDDEIELVDAPFRPYFYSFKKLQKKADIDIVHKVRLSDMETKPLYKYNFNITDDVPRNREAGLTYEDNIPFILRTRVDEPDFFTQFSHKRDLRILFLDIEQDCQPGAFFPTYDDVVTNIAYCTQHDRRIHKLSIKDVNSSDKSMLQYFRGVVDDINPDMFVYYNKSYDLPTLIKRFDRQDLDTTVFCKRGKPYVGGRDRIELGGTVIYDPYDSVKRDQSLNGNVVNRGLKAVSNYFEFKTDIPIVDTSNIHNLIGTEELKEYNADDVRRLLHVFDIYFDNVLMTAEDLKIPLNFTTNLSMTHLGIIVTGELFQQHNIVADGLNYDRFPDIFQRKKRDPNEANYQGALTNIRKTGLFSPIIKADYSSMYPNVMATFNFSPDTINIIRYAKFKKDAFKIEEKDDYYLYYIPDNKINKTIIMKVLKQEGFATHAVKQRLASRAGYKAKYKETGKRRYKALSDIEKVKANGGLYGQQGSARSPFAHAPIAVATCGVSRECMKLLIGTLEELYPNSTIEWDTDGVYFTTQGLDKVKIRQLFDRKIHEKFHRNLKLDIGYDTYDCGYFYKAKNYILKKGDILEVHGAALKASSKCNLERQLIDKMAHAKINGEDVYPIIKKFKSITNFELRDFVLSVTMGKSLAQYKTTTSLVNKLAVRAAHQLDMKPEVGNTYYYVKTHAGYELYQIAKKSQIDYKYYLKKVDSIINIFKSSMQTFKPLSEFDSVGEDQISWDIDEQSSEAVHEKLSDFY